MGRQTSLARAHEMRTLRDEGIELRTIAKFFKYSVSSVETLIRWHEQLYPEIEPFDGDTELWQEFLARRRIPF